MISTLSDKPIYINQAIGLSIIKKLQMIHRLRWSYQTPAYIDISMLKLRFLKNLDADNYN